MDLRTGKTYETKDEAVSDGVPESDIAELLLNDPNAPTVRFASGPFKRRTYTRMPNGQLLRTDGARRGYVTKNDGRGNPVRVKA